MKSPLKAFKKDPITAVRDHIAKVEAAITQTSKKLELTKQEAEKHRVARREFIRASPGEEIPAATRHGLDIATRMVDALGEELAELEDALAEARDGLAEAEDHARRDESARADEELAAFVDNRLAPDVAKATAVITAAAKAFMERAGELTLVESRDWSRPEGHPSKYSRHLSPIELVAAIIAESLAHALPEIFEREGNAEVMRRLFELDKSVPEYRVYGSTPPASKNGAQLLLGNRLRRRAAETRNPPVRTWPQDAPEGALDTVE